MSGKKKYHRWTEEDDVVTLYLYMFGDVDIPFSLEEIGERLGMGVGSLRMRMANFKAIDRKGGLAHFGQQSLEIYERYSKTPEDELKSKALKILRSINRSGDRVVRDGVIEPRKKNDIKTWTTVNALTLSYNSVDDSLTFRKGNVVLAAQMGSDNLPLLYGRTPYASYKKFLLQKQGFRCRECGKDLGSLKASEYNLHHDPKLGTQGAMYVDFKGLTQNRMLCNDCHQKIRK